jgi:hypothetical protein
MFSGLGELHVPGTSDERVTVCQLDITIEITRVDGVHEQVVDPQPRDLSDDEAPKVLGQIDDQVSRGASHRLYPDPVYRYPLDFR